MTRAEIEAALTDEVLTDAFDTASRMFAAGPLVSRAASHRAAMAAMRAAIADALLAHQRIEPSWSTVVVAYGAQGGGRGVVVVESLEEGILACPLYGSASEHRERR